MSAWYKRVELLANLAIIVVALLLGAVLVKRYLWPGTPQREAVERAQIKPGDKLSLPGLDWNKGDRTLLLVLSTTCRFCTESAPFYQRLAQEKTRNTNVNLVAILPQTVSESQKYLNDLGVSVDEIRQATPDAVKAVATPTLIIVDRTGAVIDSWVGKLPAEKEVEVVNRFVGQRPGG